MAERERKPTVTEFLSYKKGEDFYVDIEIWNPHLNRWEGAHTSIRNEAFKVRIKAREILP